jgi:hypothetical protein
MYTCTHVYMFVLMHTGIYIYIYTPVDEYTIQRLFHEILQGDFRGCSRLFGGDFAWFLVGFGGDSGMLLGVNETI